MSGDCFQWGYSNDNGPHTWAKHFPNASGARQSPIIINSSRAMLDEQLLTNPLTISANDTGTQAVTHTGQGFKVDVESEEITIQGGPLQAGDVYRIAQFHFHWGACNGWGSEHFLDGRVFASELHCVFWNTRYGSFGAAAGESDGLAVLGSFIEVGQHNSTLDPLLPQLTNIPCPDNSSALPSPISVQQMLPQNTKEYFTYKGSLTTPPCNESVTWLVFKEPITMSSQQLDAFRSIRCGDDDKKNLVDNFRPPCPLGARQLKCSF